MTDSTSLAAERLSRRRAIIFHGQAALFLLVTILDLPTRMPQPVLLVWIAWAIGLLVHITGVAAHFAKGAAWRLAEDEVTRANRATSLGIGYFAAMISALLLTLLVRIVPDIDARHVAMSVVTAGISAALISFAIMERIALHQATRDE